MDDCFKDAELIEATKKGGGHAMRKINFTDKEIRLRDLVTLIRSNLFFFIALFSVLFLVTFFLKIYAEKDIRIEKTLLAKGADGQIVRPEYLYNLKSFFFRDGWVASEIEKKLRESGIDLTRVDLAKQLHAKLVPLAGIVVTEQNLESGYVILLRVDAESIGFANQILDSWIEILNSEVKRLNMSGGVTLEVILGKGVENVRSRFLIYTEAFVVSLSLSFLISFLVLIFITSIRKSCEETGQASQS